jgi:hypothetical protein
MKGQHRHLFIFHLLSIDTIFIEILDPSPMTSPCGPPNSVTNALSNRTFRKEVLTTLQSVPVAPPNILTSV